MRTKVQLENLRKVLVGIVGPYALFMPDNLIEGFGNKIQENIDRRYISDFVLKIRLIKETISWDKIVSTDKKVHCSEYQMIERCKALLFKYPTIDSIMIIDLNDPVTRLVTRDGEGHV